MSDAPSLHAFVLCWPKWEAAAHHIAAALAGHVDHLTVLYKNDTRVDEAGPGDWRRIPSERFYGWQFQESLRLNQGDVMLHVQADASFGDWPLLASRCREAFRSMPDLGVWTPNVYHSWYTPERTQVRRLSDDGIVSVSITDGVVWALSSAMTEQLARLDYNANNLGWGLTEVAAAVAATRDLSIVMDLQLDVKHPQGSGYDRRRALEQASFLKKQLSPAQRTYVALALEATKLRDRQRVMKFLHPRYWRERLRGPHWP